MRDDSGTTNFEILALPTTLTWDRRDVPTNAKRGFWLSGTATPFTGLDDTGSGLRVVTEGRGYRSFGEDERVTLAVVQRGCVRVEREIGGQEDLGRRGGRVGGGVAEEEPCGGQEGLAGGQGFRFRQGPEPEGAPGVHDELEALETAAGGFEPGLDGLLQFEGGSGGQGGAAVGRGGPDGGGAGGLVERPGAFFGIPLPVGIDVLADLEGFADLLAGPLRFDLVLVPIAGPVAFVRPELAHERVAGHGDHLGVEDKEVVDLVGLAVFAGLELPGGDALLEVLALEQVVALPDGTAGADEAVARAQAEPEPGGRAGLEPVAAAAFAALDEQAVDAAEPEGQGAQFDGGLIEVDAVDVARGDVVLDAAEFVEVEGGFDALAGLLLLEFEVVPGELRGGLVEESAAAHGGLADLEVEDRVGVFGAVVLEQFAEGLFDQALGEHLGGVVGGALLAVDAVEVQDERALGVDAGFAVFEALDFVFLEILEALPGHEPARGLGALEVVAGGFDADEVLIGEHAPERQEAFVDRAQLVDAEFGVVDAADGAGALVGAEGQAADDRLETAIGEARAVQEGRALGSEEGRGQGAHGEGADHVGLEIDAGLAGALGMGMKPVVDEPEELLEMIVEIGAVLGSRGERDLLEVAHGFEAVAEAVGVFVDGEEFEFAAPGLGVKAKEQAVDKDEGFMLEVFRGNLEAAVVQLGQGDPDRPVIGLQLIGPDAQEGPLLVFGTVAGPFVDQEFDGLAHGELEAFGDAVGEPVALFLEGVEENLGGFAAGAEGFGGYERGDVVERVLVFAAEGVVEVESEISALGEGVAIEEKHLASRQEEHPPGAVFFRKDPAHAAGPVAFAELVFGGVLEASLVGSHAEGVFGGHALFEAAFGQAEMGLADDEPGFVVALDEAQGGDVGRIALDGDVEGMEIGVSEGVEQVSVPAADFVAAVEAVPGLFFVQGLGLGAEIELRKGLEPARRGLRARLIPLLDEVTHIFGEGAVQVVGGVILPGVRNAGV